MNAEGFDCFGNLVDALSCPYACVETVGSLTGLVSVEVFEFGISC